jgi:DNA-binding transcriptional LysR family regulator
MVASAAMAGVPLLNGFLSKEMFFAEAIETHVHSLLDTSQPYVAVLASTFAVTYSLRFIHSVFFGAKPHDLPREPHEPPFWMRVPSMFLVLACLVVGIFPAATVGPYLLPDLVRQAIERVPQMPLVLQENFTARLLDMLRTGDLDCAILAEPFPDTGLAVAPMYDEPFLAAVPRTHPMAARESITAEELKNETMLLLGTGHCFRDHVLEVCPEYARFSSGAEGIRKSFEGSSLETIKYMVASGMGVTVVPRLSVPAEAQPHVAYVPFSEPVPTRRVVLVWRRTFPRYEAIAALRNCVYACALPGVRRLS